MRTTTTTLIAVSVALALVSCAQPAGDPPAPAAPVEAAAPLVAAAAPPAPEPVADDATDPNQIGEAEVTVSIKDNALYFSYVGASFKTPGSEVGGMLLDSGDIDLSGFPPGDVLITAQLDDLAYGAGYRFSSDGWQAIAIAVDPPGDPVAPTPVFGQANWPAQFLAPVVSPDQRSVSWTDLDSDQNVYEYSVAVSGPDGVVVLDPKIKPGGSTGQ
jgi:hypothetical protein